MWKKRNIKYLRFPGKINPKEIQKMTLIAAHILQKGFCQSHKTGIEKPSIALGSSFEPDSSGRKNAPLWTEQYTTTNNSINNNNNNKKKKNYYYKL